jgi:large repetitive protein
MANGVWSFTPTSLAQGLQTVTASETNAAGLTGSSSLTFTYERTPPKLTIALADDTSGGKNITADDALTGTGDPNVTVKISEGSTVLGTTTTNGNGVWSFTPTSLAQGLQTITASETNAAGLTGYSYLTFTYKTTAATVTNNAIDLSHSEFADLAAVQADLHAAINSAGLTATQHVF